MINAQICNNKFNIGIRQTLILVKSTRLKIQNNLINLMSILMFIWVIQVKQ